MSPWKIFGCEPKANGWWKIFHGRATRTRSKTAQLEFATMLACSCLTGHQPAHFFPVIQHNIWHFFAVQKWLMKVHRKTKVVVGVVVLLVNYLPGCGVFRSKIDAFVVGHIGTFQRNRQHECLKFPVCLPIFSFVLIWMGCIMQKRTAKTALTRFELRFFF